MTEIWKGGEVAESGHCSVRSGLEHDILWRAGAGTGCCMMYFTKSQTVMVDSGLDLRW